MNVLRLMVIGILVLFLTPLIVLANNESVNSTEEINGSEPLPPPVDEERLFYIDTNDTLTIILLITILFLSAFTFYLSEFLVSGGLSLLIGLLLLFNGFNIVLSLVMIMIGFTTLFKT